MNIGTARRMAVLSMVFACHIERPMSTAVTSSGVKTYPVHMLF